MYRLTKSTSFNNFSELDHDNHINQEVTLIKSSATINIGYFAIRNNDTIEFQTKDNFINQIKQIPNRKYIHTVISKLNKENFRQLCQLDANVIVYYYPEQDLLHVKTFYLDNQQKILYVLPDSSNEVIEDGYFFAKRLPGGYQISFHALLTYQCGTKNNNDSFQKDYSSCSFLALQFGQKIEKMAMNNLNFENLNYHQLPDQLIINTANNNKTLYPNLPANILFYLPPPIIYALSQRSFPAKFHASLLKLLHPKQLALKYCIDKIYITKGITANQEKFLFWFKALHKKPHPGVNSQLIQSSLEVFSEGLSGNHYSNYYQQRTSPIRTNLLYKINQALETKNSNLLLEIFLYTYENLAVLPTATAINTYCNLVIDEAKINFSLLKQLINLIDLQDKQLILSSLQEHPDWINF